MMELKEAIEEGGKYRDSLAAGCMGRAIMDQLLAVAKRVQAGVPWEVRHRDIGVVMEGALFSDGRFDDYVRPGDSKPVLIVKAE
jgi:hypothetical protein